MVMRTIEIKKIGFKVPKSRQPVVRKKIKELFGNRFKIISKGSQMYVEGEFSNYKKRNKIIYILSGGKIGENI